LVFKKDFTCKQECIRYIDSDYTGDLDKRQSITRYVFTLSQAPLSRRSTIYSTVAFSTIEVEYMSMTKVMKETIRVQGLLDNLEID